MTPPRAWLQHLDTHAAAQLARSPGTWVLISCFVMGLLALCAFEPHAHALTGLRFAPAALAYAPLPVLAIVSDVLHRRGMSLAPFLVAGNFFVELFPAVLIGFAGPAGAFLFAAFYLITTLFHAQVLRVSARWPYFVVGFVLHAALSLALDASPEKIALWGILLPGAITTALVAGSAALRDDERREELDSTKRALHAQLLELQVQRGMALEDRVQELLGVAHDIKSPVTAAGLDLAVLERELPGLGRADLVMQAASVRASLVSLKGFFGPPREEVGEAPLASEAVAVLPIIQDVVLRVRRRHRDVAFVVAGDAGVTALLVGGPRTLERILDNLALNACEGDGERKACQVWISARTQLARLELTVEDDGPGFSSDALARSIETYRSTKKNGTGLGLFTVERLTRACGGALVRHNRLEGGARVSVSLPLA